MLLFRKKTLSLKNYFNFLTCLIPLSFIAGNLIINLNILILILSSLTIFKNELVKIKFYLLDKIICSFFLFILFTGIFNDIYFFIYDLYPKGINTTLKSIFFLKYLFLYFALRFLVEKSLIDLKYFFISSSFFSIFVCLDILYQFYFGKDIFGFEGIKRKLSGPFGDELIAGGYIQRFSLFSFFTIPFFFKHKTRFSNKIFISILFVIFLIGIILSGNRMPLIIFIMTLFMTLLFDKKLRKYLLLLSLIIPLIFFIFYNFNSAAKKNFGDFYFQISNSIEIIKNKDFESENMPQYLREFSTFYDTWLLNKYIGGGIKNFRWYCHHRKPGINLKSGFICNMHPHNYYLEILTDVGLIGFFIVVFIFLLILYRAYIKKYFSSYLMEDNKIVLPFLFLFIAEIFPLKSTGSFFTTGNSTYIFLILGILIGLINRNNSIENQN